jgi:hypothetical protein
MMRATLLASATAVRLKRTGSSELIGARSTSLASGFFGLALLLSAVVAAWLAGAGRLKRGRSQSAERAPHSTLAKRSPMYAPSGPISLRSRKTFGDFQRQR